jgi:hypothetical protein
VRLHTVDRRAKLFHVAYVGAKPQRDTSRMFDFEIGEIEFGLASSQEAYARPMAGKSDSEPFADTSACACYQDAFIS